MMIEMDCLYLNSQPYDPNLTAHRDVPKIEYCLLERS
jgi:hypothetical protein